MSMIESVSRTLVRGLCLVALLAFTAIEHSSAQSSERDNQDFELSKSIDIIVDIMRELSLGHVENTKVEDLLMSATRGMIAATDPYTEYIPEERAENFKMYTTGNYAGIGAPVRKRGDYVLFSQPYKGCPADEAGIKSGDKILAINGKDMKGIDADKVTPLLRGEPETSVTVTVERCYTGKVDTVEITRRRIHIPSVGYAGYLRDGIAYIDHTEFTEGSYNEIRSALEQLMATDSLRGLVLDYRSNGGGLVTEAVDIASLFVPRGQRIVSLMGRDSSSLIHYSTEHAPIAPNVPIVVLVNGTSASASEILAGALQDCDRAVIMGQRTYGKGIVQSTRAVSYLGMIKYTTAKYYIPSGRCIQSYNYNIDGATVIPDSLITEFRTAGGRKVYDGGGIVPDVKLEPEYISQFTYTLYAKDFVDDWTDEYSSKHPVDNFDVRSFKLTDKEYDDFCRYIDSQDIPYESETRRALGALERAVERERYDDSLNEAIATLKTLLKDDKMSNMERYRSEIEHALTMLIITRYAYQEGATEYAAVTDPDVDKAVEMLLNREEYEHILREQDLEMH